jgi:hypothetical protein
LRFFGIISISMKKRIKKKKDAQRKLLIYIALLITGAIGVYTGAMAAHADEEPVQKIHVNEGNGYSFDIVVPPKKHGKHAKGEPVTVAVEGDSMSAITNESLYNVDRGSDMEVWWRRLDPKNKLKFFVFAQGKSGYVKKGQIRPASQPNQDNGTNFQDRIGISQLRYAIQKSDLMFIAGGFNDGLSDRKKSDLDQAIGRYMDEVAAVRVQDGHAPSTVIVTDLWAQGANRLGRGRVVPVIKDQAKKHGFTFAEEQGTFDSNTRDTTDGIHYKGAAGDRIANRFEREAHLSRTVDQILASRN